MVFFATFSMHSVVLRERLEVYRSTRGINTQYHAYAENNTRQRIEYMQALTTLSLDCLRKHPFPRFMFSLAIC
jgi:hypothetical protein